MTSARLPTLTGSIGPWSSMHEFLNDLAGLWPALVAAAIVLAVTYVVSHFAYGRARSSLVRGGFQVNVALLLARLLRDTLWIVAFFIVLNLTGVGLTPLAAFVGVVGLAASLSLQQVLQNLVAGVYLLAERPFAIGDLVAVVGPSGLNHEGQVEDIQMRTTHLRSRDNELILVPNSAIFGGVVTNRTAVGGFVLHFTVTFPRDADPGPTHRKILELFARLPSILDVPAPQLRVCKVEADTWTAAMSLWTTTRDAADYATWELARAYPEATIDATGVTA